MEPQAGILGGIPIPKKLKDASMTIIEPILKVPTTSKGFIMLGKISDTMIAKSDLPQ
jgi:hypothetical protein